METCVFLGQIIQFIDFLSFHYLFAMIMDVLACGIKDLSPWCMLYADDIVLCGTRREEVEKKLEDWRSPMEDRGLKINRYKPQINLQGENLERVNTFKYLGATLAENGDLDAEMAQNTIRMEETGRGYRGFCVTEE